MSYVDFDPKPQPQPQPTFSDWLQEYWRQPHPHGLVAMLKAAMNSIPDAVNGSIAATGVPPSTEEEAFRYNLARDRGVIGAFRAASTFGPSGPLSGTTSGRYAPLSQTPDGLVPRRLSGSQVSTPGTVLARPDRFDGNGRKWSSSSGSVPSVAPPISGIAPSGGLPGRLREVEALERRTPITISGPSAALEKDPNFRQLSRILSRPLDTASAATGEWQPGPNIEERAKPPLDLQNYSEWLAQRKKSSSASSRAPDNYKNHYKSDGGDDDDFCTKRKHQEEDECSQRWRDGEFASKDHYWGCRQRAVQRWDACNKNGGRPAPWEPARWSLDPDEEVYFNTDR